MPDKPDQDPRDFSEHEEESPPAPEQIWPPPQGAGDSPDSRKVEFSSDEEAEWLAETEEIDDAIEQIRKLNGSHEDVETPSAQPEVGAPAGISSAEDLPADEDERDEFEEYDELLLAGSGEDAAERVSDMVAGSLPAAEEAAGEEETLDAPESLDELELPGEPEFEGFPALDDADEVRPATEAPPPQGHGGLTNQMLDDHDNDVETPPPASKTSSTRAATVATCEVRSSSEGELAKLWGSVFFSTEYEPPRTVTVAAVHRRAGGTQIAASLALIGASTDKERSVALADFNLRWPNIADVLDLDESPGLLDVLAGSVSLEDAMRRIQLENGNCLHVLTSGGEADHPLGSIRSRQVRAVIASLRQTFDHAIIDVAAADSQPDAQIIGAQTDGALLVVRHAGTPRESVAEVKKRFDLSGVNCLGLVLNQRSDPVPGLLYRMT